MNITIWIVTAILAAVMALTGVMKLTQPQEKLVANGQGALGDLPAPVVKGVGALEVLAALGLIVPPLVGVGTVLVPLAATGVVALMIGAAVAHGRRGEYPNVVVNVVLGAMALFVAVTRFGSYGF